ncbi:MAG: hypothetical protein WC055_09040 [Melioribacteraceae bacterium]
MNRKITYFVNFFLVIIIFSGNQIISQQKENEKKSPLLKVNGEPSYSKFNINKISTWFKNDGESDMSQNGNSGFIYPKGSWRTAVFQSGLLWGGKVDAQVRVGGSVYRQGTVPGRVIKNATGKWEAVNPNDPDVRIYRVRPDYAYANLLNEVNDGDGKDQKEVRERYKTDWMEWPAAQGAPFDDINKNGLYDPLIDIPGIPGADQTLWFVCNDFDSKATEYFYGSPPMGIEEQVTVWGYNTPGPLGNMLFRKYILINKNLEEKPFTDMYVSMWADPDVGDVGDDYVGCDSTLGLGFGYNGYYNDAVYGENVPAVGFDFVQGPIADGSPSDTAVFKNRLVIGKKNLGMTAFYFMVGGNPVYTDPTQGNYKSGTLAFYNIFQGKYPYMDKPYIDPITNLPTKFLLSGNPIDKTGWVDGLLHRPGDRRLEITSGPFNIAYGDTQEVIVAEIVAGGTKGINNLQAITLLKEYDLAAQFLFDNSFDILAAPPKPEINIATTESEITLSWGENPTAIMRTESYSKYGFNFEGYNVYQIPYPGFSISDAIRIATFDIKNDVTAIINKEFDESANEYIDKVVAFGTDSGINRSITITKDAFNSNLPLHYGQKYYFAVTAYAYNEKPPYGSHIYENQLDVIEVIPQTPFAKVDISRINVFPNPYYGANPQELNKYQRFVTFSHLPAEATIRIFNMAGQLVAHIEKSDLQSQFVRWDLNNDAGYMVASGLYIAYIQMPELGETKILKLAIIHELPILDRF